ncbi:MAG: universal stress protein [Oligoflexus sp.]
MNDRFFANGESIVVPVQVDQANDSIIPWAVAMAKLLDKKIRLIHVVQPWVQIPSSLNYGEGTVLVSLKDAIQSSIRDQAEQDLQGLCRRFPGDVEVGYKIREGHIVDCIVAEAIEDHTSFILMSLGPPRNHRVWLEGLSTPFSVMALAPVPVMVVPPHAVEPDLNANLKILLADDLRPHTEAALKESFDLLTLLNKAELHYVHVCDLDEGQIRFALERGERRFLEKISPHLCVDDILQDTCRRLEDKMTRRLEQNVVHHGLAKMKCLQKVLVGDIAQQLKNYIRHESPDILVFGRHHALHQRPFSLGRLPYRMMLEHNRPIFVIPNSE